MVKRIIFLIALALVNALAYHLAYVKFLHEVFGYADFRYEPTSVTYLAWTYLVAALPIIATRKSNSPSAVGAALIYILSYVPIQLTLTFIWAEKTLELAFLQVVMALSMVALFRTTASHKSILINRTTDNLSFVRTGPLLIAFYLFTAVALIMVIAQYHSIMRFASFDNVYELRDQAGEIRVSKSMNYIVLWLSYLIGPFYIARAIFYNRKIDWVIGFTALLVVYLSFGAKIALFTPLFMLVIKYIDKGSNDFILRLLTMSGVFVILITLSVPNEGVLRYINSVFLLRIYGSNGWSGAVYYEYFTSHALTFYTHIGPIGAVFGGYPYGENSLGQEIAQQYFSNDANFNAGFWASDGFAALGIAGIPVVTFFLGAFMRMLDKVADQHPARLINLWLLPFWMGLMNAPFTTALLSGGGLMVVLFLWMGRHKHHKL
jgi:hypothetical protein